MAFTSPAMQLEFWTELATPLTTRGLRAPAPSERNHCYVGIGTSLGELVLTAPTAKGGVACKLALKRSGRGGVEAARAIHQRLESEHLAIEQELGFHDLDWGSRESDTRVYRYRSCDLSARSEWPAAHAWLAQTAAAFACCSDSGSGPSANSQAPTSRFGVPFGAAAICAPKAEAETLQRERRTSTVRPQEGAPASAGETSALAGGSTSACEISPATSNSSSAPARSRTVTAGLASIPPRTRSPTTATPSASGGGSRACPAAWPGSS